MGCRVLDLGRFRPHLFGEGAFPVCRVHANVPLSDARHNRWFLEQVNHAE
jgi:hypothetical protein